MILLGQRLCLADKEHISGSGTFERGGYIYSTLAGVVEVIKKDTTSVITVHNFNNQTIVPAPGDIVTAKVCMLLNSKENIDNCLMDILCLFLGFNCNFKILQM